MNNGTRKAVFSPSDINYFDEAEEAWKPIDNSLKATDDGYCASLGKYTAKFSKNSDNETVEVSDGSETISWRYLGVSKNLFTTAENAAAKGNAKRKSKLSVKTESKDALNMSAAGSAVYSDAEGGIDIDYSIAGSGIKENIIVKEKGDVYHYYFLLSVAGFEMRRDADGIGVEFYRPVSEADGAVEQAPEFIMPAPFMYDADGALSDKVRYAYEKIEDGVYIFSVEADAEWINADERVFPVCIDPQLVSVSAPYISVTHDRYQWCDCCDDSGCCESGWTHIGSPYYSYICVNEIRRHSLLFRGHRQKRRGLYRSVGKRIGLS